MQTTKKGVPGQVEAKASLNQFCIRLGIAPASPICVGSRVNALHPFSPLQAIFLALRSCMVLYYWPLMGIEKHFDVDTAVNIIRYFLILTSFAI